MLTDSLSNRDTVSAPAQDCHKILFISVIVPVRNEVRFIERTLTQLTTQDYDRERFEIIVVDGESTDGTPELVARFTAPYPNIRLFTNPKRLSSAARNIGIQNAKGDVVVIVDGHCELDGTQYLTKLADAFDRSGADCIGRPQPLDVTDATTLQRAIAAARSSRLGHHPDSYIYSSGEGFMPAKSVAVAYRRSVFENIGYFDEQFDACEDVELNHRIDRAGLRCYFSPGIAVRYAPRSNLWNLFHQMVRYGRGRIRLLRKHRDTLSLKTLVPGVFLLACVLGALLACFSRSLAVCALAGAASYVAILLAASIAIAVKHRDPAIVPWLPCVFATVHVGAGVGLLWEACLPRGINRQEQRPLATSPLAKSSPASGEGEGSA